MALGCGEYQVLVLGRGGRQVVGQVEWTRIEWTRILDDTSTCRVEGIYPVDDFGVCDRSVRQTRQWQHELAVLRDGVAVWAGPVVQPQFNAGADSFVLNARDFTAWWDRRFVHSDKNYAVPTDCSTIFQDIFNDALAPDPSPNFACVTTPSGVLTTLTVLASQYVAAGRPLRDLGNLGVDWTCLLRTVIAGGSEVPTASLGRLHDDHFQLPPLINLDGLQQVNHWVVTGSGGGSSGNAVFGEATDSAAALRDGLLEATDSVSSVNDNAGAQSAAATRVALTRFISPVEKAILQPDWAGDIMDLIPGALATLDLQLTEPVLLDEFRLYRVVASVTADAPEQIELTFTQPGSTRVVTP